MTTKARIPVIEVRRIGQGPGFLRNNRAAIGAAAGFSAFHGFNTALVHFGQDLAFKSVTDPTTDPAKALWHLDYLRNRFNEQHSGIGYTLGALLNGTVDDCMQEEARMNEWFDQVEEYWQSPPLE